MTVKELVERLKQFDENEIVILISYTNTGYSVYTDYNEAVEVFKTCHTNYINGVAIV